MGALTYRSVAEHLGISDRMVVYYLPTKADLVGAAATELSGHLQGLLDEAFGDRRRSPEELLRRAWPVLSGDPADRVVALFLEIIGLAAAGTAPFDALARAILDAWATWLAERTEGATPAVRRRTALGVIARIDGLLLLRHALGSAAADDAARSLGITGRRS